MLLAKDVPRSEREIRAIPHIMAGFLALSAYSPDGLARISKARAGAEITSPFIAEERPMAFPYKGIVGMTAPTPRKRINCATNRSPKGLAVDFGTSTPAIIIDVSSSVVDDSLCGICASFLYVSLRKPIVFQYGADCRLLTELTSKFDCCVNALIVLVLKRRSRGKQADAMALSSIFKIAFEI
jgi:hypothetical protein